MNNLSTARFTFLVLLIIACSTGFAQNFEMPVKGKVDLSSNFCEYRPAHFHGGIDIRTGGAEGRKIYSPVDGYVWRIKYAYDGYGKALYLKDNKGFIYVFGHLSRLNDRLEKIVSGFQVKNRVYSFDSLYPEDSVRVEKGELIAYSGQSGIGAPHIHFEMRNGDNMPINPLSNGINVIDRIPPQLEAVGFAYQDDSSIFADGSRRLRLRPTYDKEQKIYSLKAAVPLRGPFGIIINSFDRIRHNGPKLNIYRARLFIDDYIYYETIYENYDYAETGMADLCFDNVFDGVKGESWNQLFIPRGKNFRGDRSLYEFGGVFKVNSSLDYGRHDARVELYDAAGNMSELKFEFIMIPSGQLFAPVWTDDTTCYLEASSDNRFVDIKELNILTSFSNSRWTALDPSRIQTKPGGTYMITVPSGRKKPDALKVEVIGDSGWELTDLYMVLDKRSDIKFSFDYQLMDGGILFNIATRRQLIPPPEIGIIYDDGYIRRITTKPAGDGHYAAFCRNSDIKSAIINFELYENGADYAILNRDAKIFQVGNSPSGKARLSSDNLTVVCDNKALYSPANLEVKRQPGRYANFSSILDGVFSIGPDEIPLADNIQLFFTIPASNQQKTGIYRLSDKGKWLWLEHRRSEGGISADSRFLGEFALVRDVEPPRVKGIYPPDGKTVFTSYPEIYCTVSEELSGIEDHENIEIFLDGDWLVPEYDPETEILKTYPNKKLEDGRHNLKITVSDRSDNVRTVHSHFFVNTKKKN